MPLEKTFIPTKPFDQFKWQWACLTCTESLNDPVILLGVLSKMRKWEGTKKYSSSEFSSELVALETDIKDTSISVNLSGRGGSRNIIRNSGQYWKALGLIDDDSRGIIRLTEFGRRVADHEISQAEFAATTIKSLTLPNPHIQNNEVCNLWQSYNVSIKPLILILNILKSLYNNNVKSAYITADELINIIIPLSPNTKDIEDYVNFITWYRKNEIDITLWPNCCLGANDKRMAREFLLFLNNYGYIKSIESTNRYDTKYFVSEILLDEIQEISELPNAKDEIDTVMNFRVIDIVSEIERKRVLSYRMSRPNQAKFRKNILASYNSRCILTNVSMAEVLEAAHIKPVQYNGNDSVGNGLCMRLDIHQLFDTGHLRIAADGTVLLSPKCAKEYCKVIPLKIVVPDFVNKEFLQWRWNNYNGI